MFAWSHGRSQTPPTWFLLAHKFTVTKLDKVAEINARLCSNFVLNFSASYSPFCPRGFCLKPYLILLYSY